MTRHYDNGWFFICNKHQDDKHQDDEKYCELHLFLLYLKVSLLLRDGQGTTGEARWTRTPWTQTFFTVIPGRRALPAGVPDVISGAATCFGL
jgi:hypothetical protein